MPPNEKKVSQSMLKNYTVYLSHKRCETLVSKNMFNHFCKIFWYIPDKGGKTLIGLQFGLPYGSHLCYIIILVTHRLT